MIEQFITDGENNTRVIFIYLVYFIYYDLWETYS